MPRALKEEDGKRYSLSARTTLELNQALKDAAQKNGRSVSQEIEFRLEQSFAVEKVKFEAEEKNPMRPFDLKTELMMRSIKLSAGSAMTKYDASWVDNVYARAAVTRAIDAAVASYISNNVIEISKSELDFDKLQHAARWGATTGKILGDLSNYQDSDAMLRELKETLFPSVPTLWEAACPEDVRQDVTLSGLKVSVAA